MKTVGKGTVERRGKGRWRLKVTITDDFGEKSRLSKSVDCRTKTEACGRLDEWRMELMQSDETVVTRKMNLNEYLEDYIRYCHDVKHLSPNTVRGYRDIMRNRWLPRLGGIALDELTPKMIDEQVNWLRTKGSVHGGPLSAKTVNEALGFLSTALDRAERLGCLQANPCRRVSSLPSGRREEVKVLSEGEVRRMKSIVRGHPSYRFATAVNLSLDTGMRRGEICGLLIRDVDLDNARIHVCRALAEGSKYDTYNGDTLEEKAPKSRRSNRWVSLPSTMVEKLRSHLEVQFHRLAYNGIEQTPDTPVFADDLGEPMRPSKYTKDFIAFATQQRFDVTLHGLRHTHASLLLMAGMPIADVSRRLGHESVDITYRIYAHFIPESDGGAAQIWESCTLTRETKYVMPTVA